jgi:hypothetical protein
MVTSQLITGTHTLRKEGKRGKEIHTRIHEQRMRAASQSFGKLEAKHALVLDIGTFVAAVL